MMESAVYNFSNKFAQYERNQHFLHETINFCVKNAHFTLFITVLRYSRETIICIKSIENGLLTACCIHCSFVGVQTKNIMRKKLINNVNLT